MWRPVGMLQAWVSAKPHTKVVWFLIPRLIPELMPSPTPIHPHNTNVDPLGTSVFAILCTNFNNYGWYILESRHSHEY
jgi:hypothetical protein